MARLDKSVIGKLRGAVGDVVFRQRNGKVFVSRKPQSFIPGTDKDSVDRRLKFAFSSKLSSTIYSLPDLASLWRQAAPHGRSVYHFIVQVNIPLVNPYAVTERTTITPPQSGSSTGSGFVIDCTSAMISPDAFNVEFAPVGNSAGIDLSREQNAKVACVLCLTNPTDKSLPKYQFVSCVSESKQIVLGSPLVFSIPLAGTEAAKVRTYEDKKLLCTMITLDAERKPVRYSGTVVK
ncbi:MAG TPA: hypothetical protein VLX91_10335 [Candidatus Acidoferrales bacterium]|nr:hypothetical protein [Candidatus Acidoferrales bacterium]